jgi:hypothetical protein
MLLISVLGPKLKPRLQCRLTNPSIGLPFGCPSIDLIEQRSHDSNFHSQHVLLEKDMT